MVRMYRSRSMSAAENRRYPERDLAGLDQPLGLEEPDLGRADVREFRLELGEHLADAELAARGLLAHEVPPARRLSPRLAHA